MTFLLADDRHLAPIGDFLVQMSILRRCLAVFLIETIINNGHCGKKRMNGSSISLTSQLSPYVVSLHRDSYFVNNCPHIKIGTPTGDGTRRRTKALQTSRVLVGASALREFDPEGSCFSRKQVRPFGPITADCSHRWEPIQCGQTYGRSKRRCSPNTNAMQGAQAMGSIANVLRMYSRIPHSAHTDWLTSHCPATAARLQSASENAVRDEQSIIDLSPSELWVTNISSTSGLMGRIPTYLR